MAKELPYFKFVPAEWITGNITLCSMEAQGLFINLCAFYWVKDCSISLANAKQRFSNCFDLLSELKANEIISVSEDEKIIIKFLDEQMEKFTDISIKRSESGKLKGKGKKKAKAKQLHSKSLSNAPYKIREDNNILYSIFYDSEIEKSNNNEQYLKFVKILFGENNLGVPLKSVLKMEQQVTLEQFEKLWFLREKYKFSITDVLEKMENWKKLNGNTTVYRTFLTFIKRDNPAIVTE